jgi:hypothetical protein
VIAMNIEWCAIGVFTRNDETVVAPWLIALESLRDSTHLKIEAEGEWTMVASVIPGCGPDGLAGFGLPSDQLVLPSCRYGALIGKLGGSSAAHRAPPAANPAGGGAPAPAAGTLATDEPFPIGATCLHKFPDGVSGPLFIGFNTLWRPIQVQTIKLRIFGGRLPEQEGKPETKTSA